MRSEPNTSQPDDPLSITCPQCGFREVMQSECWRCGVVFAKLKESRGGSNKADASLTSALSVQPRSPAFPDQGEVPKPISQGAHQPSITAEITTDQSPHVANPLSALWARAPRKSLRDSALLCAHLEQAFGFQISLSRALQSAPLSSRARAYISANPPQTLTSSLTLSAQLAQLQLLPPHACRLIAVAERSRDTLQGLREARLQLERSLERRRVFAWSLKCPRYLAFYTLLSELIYALLLGQSLISLVTLVSLLTILAYPLCALSREMSSMEPWLNRIRFALNPAESRLNFTRAWARLLRAEVSSHQAALTALSVAQIPPSLESEARSALTAHPESSESGLSALWEQSTRLGLTRGQLSSALRPQDVARVIFEVSLQEERAIQSWIKWGAIADRVIVSGMIALYLAYQILTQLSQVFEQLDSLEGVGGLNGLGIIH